MYEEQIGAMLYALVSAGVRWRSRSLHLTALTTLSTIERTGRRRITDLAAIQGITQPSMTTLVKNLEQDGLVERQPDPDDGRVALVSLTEAGGRLLRERRQESTSEFVRLASKLSPGEQAALAAAIPALDHLHRLQQQERDPAGGARLARYRASVPMSTGSTTPVT